MICYTVQTGQVLSTKWTSPNSERPNLNFNKWHEDIRF
jgi:hypothetical protein